MKINPFEIAKKISSALRNKDRYKAKLEELKSSPLVGGSGSAKAVYDAESNRISRIECIDVPQDRLDRICEAVNSVLEKSDVMWNEIEKN